MTRYCGCLMLRDRAAPQLLAMRFFTHGQRAQGDRHVYASRTRFIPEACLACSIGQVGPMLGLAPWSV
jgi:hypothetical protein